MWGVGRKPPGRLDVRKWDQDTGMMAAELLFCRMARGLQRVPPGGDLRPCSLVQARPTTGRGDAGPVSRDDDEAGNASAASRLFLRAINILRRSSDRCQPN